MNVIPSKVGADPKKIAVLVGLVAIAGYFYFSNSNSGGGSPSAPVASRTPVAASSAIAPGSIGRSTYRVVAAIRRQRTGVPADLKAQEYRYREHRSDVAAGFAGQAQDGQRGRRYAFAV